jgi:tetratricopeptide (TPR) repeat protein
MSKLPSKFNFSKKKVFAVVGVVVLIAAAVGAGFLAQRLLNGDNSSSNQTNQEVGAKAPPLPTTVSQAQDLAQSGQMDQSNQKLQQALEQPSASNDDKYNAYWQLGVNASNSNQPQQAIKYFEQAEAIKPTYTVSHLIAEQAEMLGDKTTAIAYYKKAITQLDKNSPVYDSDKNYLEGKVTSLGGTL